MTAIELREIRDRLAEHRHGRLDNEPRQHGATEAIQHAGIEKRPAHEAVGAADELGDLDFGAPIEYFQPDPVTPGLMGSASTGQSF